MKFNYGCLAVLLTIALAGAVSAAYDNYFIVNNPQGMPGDTITMPIKLQNAANIGSMDLTLNSNSECSITIISIEKGSLTKDTLFDWMKKGSGVATISFASSQPITGAGTIAIVTLNVGNDVPNQIEMNKKNNIGNGCSILLGGEVFDTNSKSLGNHGSKALFTLGPALKGDGNHDGKVDSNDALTALQMAIGKLPQNTMYDMNGDGVVKANDAMEILKLSVVPMTVMDIHVAETPAQINDSPKSGAMQKWKP